MRGLEHGSAPAVSASTLDHATAERALAQNQLRSNPSSGALLDEHGYIVAVNEAWRRFAWDNEASPATLAGVGLNYLDVCLAAEDATAQAAYTGIRAICEGRAEPFELTYPCHSPEGLRWCKLRAMRAEGVRGAVVSHLDVTEARFTAAKLKIQMSATRTLGARMTMAAACREVGLAVCEALDGDFVGIWTLEPRTWTMRCVDTWIRDERLASFERASREAALGPGSGLPGRAFSTAKVYWVTHRDVDIASAVASVRFTIMPPAALGAGFRTAVAFPLKCGDDVLAVVEVLSPIACELDPSMVELLDVAGELLALWELRERAERAAHVAMQQADDASAQLEAVLAGAPAVVTVIDEQDRIQFINRTPPTVRKDAVVGRSWRDYLPCSVHGQIETALKAVFETGEVQTYELSLQGPNGHPIWFANHVGPMRSAGHTTRAVIISQDVTDAKRGLAELADAQRLATVGTLAAGVAHEINTPVQFVNDSIHFLKEASSDTFAVLEKLLAVHRAVVDATPEARLTELVEEASEAVEDADLEYLLENVPKALERSVDGLERVAAIVRSMKEFSHPASKDKAPVDLNRAIRATLTVARNEYKYVAHLETEFGELPSVTCHVNDINQAVLNIVINAAHAIGDRAKETGALGTIRVSTRQEDAKVVIAISDTGGGIPESIQQRVFDPFFTTKEVGRGTGQGLSIARRAICEKHGGELTFEVQPGVGTTFYIRLPIDDRSDA